MKKLMVGLLAAALSAAVWADGVAVATWTGLGEADNLADPANWACEDANGDAVAEAVPDAGTMIRLAGSIGVDFPAGMELSYSGVLIDGTTTLTRDCDWRGFGDIAFAVGAKLDLAGHRLDLPTVQNLQLQPVEYIESTGSQVINTGIVPGPTTSLDIDLTTVGEGYYESTLFGTGNWNQHEYMLTLRNDGGRPMSFCWFGDYKFFDYYVDRHLRLTVDSANGALTLFDGDTEEQLSQLETTDFQCNSRGPLHIFGQNGSQGYKAGKYRVHSFKITQGGTLVRDFIPVRSVQTSDSGLYDLVEHKFYPAAGLLCGDDVGDTTFAGGIMPARLLVGGTDRDIEGFSTISYIESTGGQVIKTGIIPGTTTTLDIDFTTFEYINEGTLFGTQTWNQRAYMFTLQSGQFRWFGNAEMFTFYPNTHLRMIFDCDAKRIYVNDGETGERLATVNAGDNAQGQNGFTNSNNQELSLFGQNDGSKAGRYRLHALKITQGGELVRDYVPVVRHSDGQPGLYDKVSGAFHTANGLKWPQPEITDSTAIANDFRPTAWIQSTGAQVLDTGVTPGSTTSLDIDFETFAWAVENSLFGTASFNQHQYLLTPRSDFGSQQFCWFGNYKAFDYFPNRRLRMVVDSTNGVILQYDGETGEELTRLATTDFACSGGTLTLFGMNNRTKTGKYRIYAMKITQGGELVRDLVPGYSASQKRYGLYDRVNHEFHGADGLLSGPFVDYAASDAAHGTLALDVPADSTYSINTVLLSGSLGIEKEGAGTFTLGSQNAFAGEIAVNAGKFASGVSGLSMPFGLPGNKIVVNAEGTFDLCGYPDLTSYLFTVNGGRIANSGGAISNIKAIISSLALTADAAFDVTASWGLIGTGYAETCLDLGGHTLTLNIANGMTFYLFNSTVTNGKLVLMGPGQVWVDKNHLKANGAEIVHNCAGLPLAHDVLVRDFTDNSQNAAGTGEGVVRVSGRYLATTDAYRACVLENGATLDLSERAEAFPTTSAATGMEGQMLAFADGATVTLDIGMRKLPGGTRIVAWEDPPENIATLQFNLHTDRLYSNPYLLIKNDGIYVDQTYTILIFR